MIRSLFQSMIWRPLHWIPHNSPPTRSIPPPRSLSWSQYTWRWRTRLSLPVCAIRLRNHKDLKKRPFSPKWTNICKTENHVFQWTKDSQWILRTQMYNVEVKFYNYSYCYILSQYFVLNTKFCRLRFACSFIYWCSALVGYHLYSVWLWTYSNLRAQLATDQKDGNLKFKT